MGQVSVGQSQYAGQDGDQTSGDGISFKHVDLRPIDYEDDNR